MKLNRMRMLAFAAMVLAGRFAGPVLAGDDKKPDFPKFEEVTKDCKEVKGFFTLYHDAKKDKLFARVPGSMIKQKFLWTTSINKGREYAGWQWNDGVVYFERFGKRLVLMAADSRYEKGGNNPLADVIQRTYTDQIIRAIPIATEINGDVVFDLGAVLKSDPAGTAGLFGGSANPGLSRVGSVRSFPQNTEININLAVADGRGESVMAGLHFSIAQLPGGDGFEKRVSDDRLGYWLLAVKDWTTPHSAKTVFKRYLHRWRLRKSEPNKAVSDVKPEDQIVYYIEKTVPVQYRHYIREGILEWNKAFEAAGLRNAVKVVQQTDSDPETRDLDPEDARYNFFRWITTGRAFAMGPSRANPFTGQIYDADIIFDDAYVRYWTHSFEVHGPKVEAAWGDDQTAEFLQHHPEWGVGTGDSFEEPGISTDAMARFDEVRSKTWGRHPEHQSACRIGMGAARNLAMASLSATSGGLGGLPEDFLGQAIKETVMHEVGHTLGLMHNFKGSTWKRLAEVRNGSSEEDYQLTGSVMDYNPYNFEESGIQQHHFATPTLGPYDYWAIEYAYKPFLADPKDESAPKNEADMLKKIASRCAEDGLGFANDYDTSAMGPDPSVNRWDNGKDPIDFANYQMDRSQRLWGDGFGWAIQDGKALYKARRIMNLLIGEYGFGGRMVARLVGGQYINRYHKGDPDAPPPIQVVPAKKQRAALELLGSRMFSDDAFQFPPELLNGLAAGRWSHWDSDAMDRNVTYDVHDRVLGVQASALFQLMNPFTINRIYDSQMFVPADEDAMTVPEFFERVEKIVWTELGKSDGTYTTRKPMISSFRRSLQRNHLQRLIDMVLSKPGNMIHADCHAVARMSLKSLGASIDETLDGGRLDEYTRAHLLDSQTRIAAALEAEFLAPESRRASRGITFIIGSEAAE